MKLGLHELYVIASFTPYSGVSIYNNEVYTDANEVRHACFELQARTKTESLYADTKFSVMTMDDYISERLSQEYVCQNDSLNF